ncbi:MAG: efflux transporter outer membrane subunit [Sulfuricurvum sp.]|nr:efflux transporter outer membrane subunit [Sulfuricurvum sp.]
MMKTKSSLLLFSIFILSGCSIGPDYIKPASNIPDTFHNAQEFTKQSNIDKNWWESFQDPILTKLVTKALESNYDIAISNAQLEAYLGQFDQIESSLYPQINGNASFDRKYTQNPMTNRFQQPGGFSTYAASLSMASYEIDLYGRVKRTEDAARSQLMASEYNHRNIGLTVSAGVCASYARLSSLNDQIKLANENITATQEIEKNTLLKYKLGAVSETEWLNASAQVHASRSTLTGLQAARTAEETTLNTLLGENTKNITVGSMESINIPEIPAGLPSQLLTRRPDVAIAEQNLIAANAKIGITKAAYFPKFSLTAMMGVQSDTLSNVFSDPTKLWQITPVASIPIFTAGLIDAQMRIARADYNQSVAIYQKTVLTALNDTDNALAQNTKAKEQLLYNNQRADALKKAFEQAQLRYKIGTYSYTDLLVVQQNYLAAQQQAIISKQNILTTTIGLYKALGGGWEN